MALQPSASTRCASKFFFLKKDMTAPAVQQQNVSWNDRSKVLEAIGGLLDHTLAKAVRNRELMIDVCLPRGAEGRYLKLHLRALRAEILESMLMHQASLREQGYGCSALFE